MLAALGRLVVVTFAVVTAAAVAVFILFRLGLEHATNALRNDDDGLIKVSVWLWQGFTLSVAATLLVGLAVIVIGEVARIRSALFYIIGGGLAVAAPLLSQLPLYNTTAASSAGDWHSVTLQVFATAGFAAGGIYWLLAGRKC